MVSYFRIESKQHSVLKSYFDGKYHLKPKGKNDRGYRIIIKVKGSQIVEINFYLKHASVI